MEIAVRLRRKPRDYGFMPPGREVGAHNVTDEILTGLARYIFSNRHFSPPMVSENASGRHSCHASAFGLDKSADRVKPTPLLCPPSSFSQVYVVHGRASLEPSILESGRHDRRHPL